MNRYFKRYWNELRGDDFPQWGSSWWFFETDETGEPLRQIECYENGTKLRYSDEKSEDTFGQLSASAIDLKIFSEFEIDRKSFEDAWQNGPFLND